MAACLLLTGVGVCAWWFLSAHRHHTREPASGPVNLAPRSLSNDSSPLASPSPSSNGWSEPDIPVGALTSQNTSEWFRKLSPEEQSYWKETSKRVMTASDTKNIPIDFWGLVLDQDGKPLEGVYIMASVRQWIPVFPASAGSRFVTNRTTTDSRGHFDLGGVRGDVLTLHELAKEGYELARSKIGFGYSTSEEYRSNRDKPEIYRMYKLRGAEPTVSWDSYQPRSVPADGTPVFLNLVTGEFGNEPVPSTDLCIAVRRTPENLNAPPQGPSHWAVNIRVKRGGVLQTEDLFAYWAPETGYVAELDAVPVRNVPGDMWSAKLKFYLKVRERLHARLEMHCYLDDSGRPKSVRYTTWLNPTGSRNLEFLYEKKISDPEVIRRIDEETARGLKP